MAVTDPAARADIETRHGYMMMIERTRPAGPTWLSVRLGFGREEPLAIYRTEEITFNPGEWYHVVFTYDGEGTGRIYINGELAAENQHEGKGGIKAGKRDLWIGERGAAIRHQFPGRIGPVRLYHRVIEAG